jgi:hypothetical protein
MGLIHDSVCHSLDAKSRELSSPEPHRDASAHRCPESVRPENLLAELTKAVSTLSAVRFSGEFDYRRCQCNAWRSHLFSESACAFRRRSHS